MGLNPVSHVLGEADSARAVDGSRRSNTGRSRLFYLVAAVLAMLGVVSCADEESTPPPVDTEPAAAEFDSAGLPNQISRVDWAGVFLRQEFDGPIHACLSDGDSEPIACRRVFLLEGVPGLATYDETEDSEGFLTLNDVRITGTVEKDDLLVVDDIWVADGTDTSTILTCPIGPKPKKPKPGRIFDDLNDLGVVHHHIDVVNDVAHITVVALTAPQFEAICEGGYPAEITDLATVS
ncbi:MAG: hypothetical protein V3V01_10855 [Acidimicrobiales bacterium]